ncbi:MAG: glycosyltransferase family 2 protein, partial [Candidatus Cryptobacteroides sp.]
MDCPKISVIVPVYNAESTIRRCVDSILAQTFTDFECLLIDDGSKDRSGEICDEYAAKDSRVRVFHKENGGVSSARNVGLDNAKGEWVTFVDSDDWIDSYYLSSFEIEEEIDFSCTHMMVEGWKEWESIPLLD